VSTAVVFDIEGTIGDLAFVRQVLFPYARARTASHLERHWGDLEVQEIVEAARQASGKPLASASAAAGQFLEWIDLDKKITPLKALQGILWREGYEAKELVAHLYDDAVAAFDRWSRQGHRLYIYSSGSIDAQKLYLRYSSAGDLTPLFSGYFDTTTGPKADAASYGKIASAIGAAPTSIVFFSDSVAEVTAAMQAQLRVSYVDRTRPGDSHDASGPYPVIGSFQTLIEP
jgi:enolase-phosphatase E1